MPKLSDQHRQWAKIGALARIAELQAELAEIYRAFPELKRGGRPGSASSSAGAGGDRKRRFPAAGKEAISQGMREYWARRKALAAKAAKAAEK